MKRITTKLLAGLLIFGLTAPAMILAQELEAERAEPAKAPKLTLQSVEAQVTTLQGQVSSLQSTVSSLQTTVSSLQPSFAVVFNDGTLVRGSSGVKSGRASKLPGRYEVIFTKDVSHCAYVATLGDTDAGTVPAGEISVATREANADGVFVETANSSGIDTDNSFHLSVVCP